MNQELLLRRRARVRKLMMQSLSEGFTHKVAQARYILLQIDLRMYLIASNQTV